MDAPPVQYVKTSDGYDIACVVAGEGKPFVFMHGSWSNVQVAWKRHKRWMEGLAQRFKLVSFDPRGWGLSTRGLPADLTLDDFEKDLPAVIDGMQLPRVVLYAIGGWGLDAVRYAHAHPERVEALILGAAIVEVKAFPMAQFNQLALENWEVFLGTLAPRGLPADEYDAWMDTIRETISYDDWNNVMVPAHWPPDRTEEDKLRNLKVPLLVLHPRTFPSTTRQESQRVAALVPNARFVLLDGDSNNVYNALHGNPDQALAAIDEFLKDLPERAPAVADSGSLSERELEVLRLLAQGKSNPQIAEELFITRNTVQNHVSSILIKLNLQNRSQAAVYAQQHGIV